MTAARVLCESLDTRVKPYSETRFWASYKTLAVPGHSPRQNHFLLPMPSQKESRLDYQLLGTPVPHSLLPPLVGIQNPLFRLARERLL
jgi:hypothetical protein